MQTDHFYLEIAMQEAELAVQEGTYPIGAVLVSPNSQILSKGRNKVYTRIRLKPVGRRVATSLASQALLSQSAHS